MAREKRTRITTDWVDSLRAVDDTNVAAVHNRDLIPAALLTEADGSKHVVTRRAVKSQIDSSIAKRSRSSAQKRAARNRSVQH